MLSIAAYKPDYVAGVRARIVAQLAAYRALKAPAGPAAAFEAEFFPNLCLALDHYFDHRARAQEGKDGGPLNELRMICNAAMHQAGVLTADKTIKYDPARSILGLKLGDPVRMDLPAFERLADAVLAEIAKRYA